MTWTLYKEIKYATDGIPGENLTDFPKLVSVVTDSDIASELSGGGGIKFTSADGMTNLAFGLYPSTDLANGTVLARVKLTLLTAASVGDVICRLYYSATESTSEDKAGTVSNAYELFAPLEEDPSGSAPQMYDWVSETNLGTSAGTMTGGDLIAGEVGNGLDFDGSDDYIDFGALSGFMPGSEGWTIGTICKPTDNADNRTLVSNFSSTGTFSSITTSSSVASTVEDGSNHSIGATCSSGMSAVIYLDGSSVGSGSLTAGHDRKTILRYDSGGFIDFFGGTETFRGNVRVGGTQHTSDPFLGLIDEVRLSSTDRSANWLAYSHQDDFDNADTFSVGTEQGAGGSSVAPDDCSHSHTTDSPAITQAHAVSPDDCLHAHAADSPTISQSGTIVPDDCLHAHTADSPAITQTHTITPDDCLHGHTAESPAISQVHIVTPTDCLHAHTADSPAITVGGTIDPEDSLHAHAADSPAIDQVHLVTPADCLHAHTADSPTISGLGVADDPWVAGPMSRVWAAAAGSRTWNTT